MSIDGHILFFLRNRSLYIACWTKGPTVSVCVKNYMCKERAFIARCNQMEPGCNFLTYLAATLHQTFHRG